jgi:hypothetical protein
MLNEKEDRLFHPVAAPESELSGLNAACPNGYGISCSANILVAAVFPSHRPNQ